MNLKARFKPRAEGGLLSQLVQEAWQDYQDKIASKEKQAEVAETIARHFETLIPPSDFEVLERYHCIARRDHCNVRVYNNSGEKDSSGCTLPPYREAFGIKLPREIPVLGTGGFGYPSIAVCEPDWKTDAALRELDPYFAELLTMRKQYQAEYKASMAWPWEYHKETGQHPTWGEIAAKFPVLGDWITRETIQIMDEEEERTPTTKSGMFPRKTN